MVAKTSCHPQLIWTGSSEAEQVALNHQVVGSIPTRSSILKLILTDKFQNGEIFLVGRKVCQQTVNLFIRLVRFQHQEPLLLP